MKTLSDPRVRDFLAANFVPVLHNQLPGLYCATSAVQHPVDLVDRCPESAGGGNLRFFLCSPAGELLFELLGYWKPDRFLEELRRGAEIAASADPAKAHLECRARHERSADRAERLLVRAHDEARADLFQPVGRVLERIEDEIYTKGAIG